MPAMKFPPPPEPRGWFRWLHNQSAVRNPSRFASLAEDFDLREIAWTAESAGLFSWALGRSGRTGVLEQFWSGLSARQQGSALAGLSERDDSDGWISLHLAGASFDAVSACQIACQAVRKHQTGLLASILGACPDLAGSVPRYEGPLRKVGRFADTINLLSDRCVDLILEAALLFENAPAVRLALKRGAKPDLPLWLLERSCNSRHCALSYAINTRQRASVTALLEAGASPVGTEFSSLNRPLFEAVAHGWEALAMRLLDSGASFERDAGRSDHRFFPFSKSDVAWVRATLGRLTPLVPVGTKACFHIGDGQGGKWQTFLTAAAGHVGQLSRYATRGLDLRLSAEELLDLEERRHRKAIVYFLSEIPAPDRIAFLRRLRKRTKDHGLP